MQIRLRSYLLLIFLTATIVGLNSSTVFARQAAQQTSECKVEQEVYRQAKITYDGASKQLSLVQKDYDSWKKTASLKDKYIPEPWVVNSLAFMVGLIQPDICTDKLGGLAKQACETVDKILEIDGADFPYNPFDFDPSKFIFEQGNKNYQQLQNGLVESMDSEQFWENVLWGASRLEFRANTLLTECQNGKIPNAIQFADGNWPENGEVELSPETNRLVNAGTTAFKQKNYFQAAVNFSQALLLQPNSATIYYSLGAAYGWDENNSKALGNYQNAIDLNPNNPLYFWARGTIYVRQGEKDLALKDYKRYVELIGKESANPDVLKYIEVNDKPISCEGSPASRLVIGQQGRLAKGLGSNNLRDKPTKKGNKIGQILESDTFTVLDGPVCADGFAWWQVKFNGFVGWTAEGQGSEYWLEPVIENTSTNIKKDIIGFWSSNIDCEDCSDSLEFSADGIFSYGAFEVGIKGTYTFITDNRIKIVAQSCYVVCDPLTWETDIAIDGNIMTMAFYDGVYRNWDKVR